MSYSGHEPLTEIISTLRMNLPELQAWLHAGRDIGVLHGHVEMLSCLLERYDRGEIIDTETPPRRSSLISRVSTQTHLPQPIPAPRPYSSAQD